MSGDVVALSGDAVGGIKCLEVDHFRNLGCGRLGDEPKREYNGLGQPA
jgi:hypothetical protein